MVRLKLLKAWGDQQPGQYVWVERAENIVKEGIGVIEPEEVRTAAVAPLEMPQTETAEAKPRRRRNNK